MLRLPALAASSLFLALLAACDRRPIEAPTLPDDHEEWIVARHESLRAQDGWLNLVGLFWLDEGSHSLGADEDNDLRLESPGSPPTLGVFHRDGSLVRFEAEIGGVELDGQPIQTARLDPASDPAETLAYDSLRLFLISRGDRIGVRVRDLDSPLVREFEGLDLYPFDPGLTLVARFEPWDEPRSLPIPNILGEDLDQTSPGRIHFEIGPRSFSLLALEGGDEGDLFIVFGDETNGEATYAGGRFVYTSPPNAESRVLLDFNRAYNPPCVFTPFATCPLPPAENRLPIAIAAGERSWRGH